jgi:hypothetical protein
MYFSFFLSLTFVDFMHCSLRLGLAMGWYSMNVSSERQPIEKLKPKVNTKG